MVAACRTHTHTQLSSVEQLEPRALLAGLIGGFASPLAATAPLPTGADRAAGIVLAEPARSDTTGIGSAAVPFQVTPLVLAGAQAGPTIASAVQHGTGGSFQVVPVGQPGTMGGAAIQASENAPKPPGETRQHGPSSTEDAPRTSPDSGAQPSYRPQWVLPPSMPGGPFGAPPWMPGLSADEQSAISLGGENPEVRKEIEEFLQWMRENSPSMGGYPLSAYRYWGAYFDQKLRQSHVDDGQGPCVSWVIGIKEAGIEGVDEGLRWIRIERVQWPIKSSSPVWTDHLGFRVTMMISGAEGDSEHFFVDNGWLGGGDNVFFSDDVPEHYESPFVPNN